MNPETKRIPNGTPVQWKARCASQMTLSGVDIASLVAGT